MNKIVIFDFDGTISDSSVTVFKIINKFAKEFNYVKLSERKIKEYKKQYSINEIIIHKIGISKLAIPFLLRKMHHAMSESIKTLYPVYGIKKNIFDLKKQNVSLYILTYNKLSNVTFFLKKFKMEYFKEIYCCNPYLGKAWTIKKLLKKYKLSPEKVFYVGDDVNDIRVAKKSGLRSVGVTWGISSIESLRNESPEFIFEDPKMLKKLLLAD